MKKSILTLAAVAALATSASAATWTRVTTADQLRAGAEYVLVSDPRENVMSTNVYSTSGIQSFRIPTSLEGYLNVEAGTIDAMPSSAAKLNVEKVGNNYALKQINGTETGYLCPQGLLNSDYAGRRSLALSPSPVALSFQFLTAEQAENKKDDSGITLFTEGAVIIKAINQTEYNILGNMWNPAGDTSYFAYQFVQQNDTPVYLYVNDSTPGTDFAPSAIITPENGKQVSNVAGFTLSFAGATSVDLSDDFEESDMTATLNGQPIDFPTCDYYYPYNFKYATPKDAPGKYEFRFKAGTFVMKNSKGQNFTSDEIVITYNVVATGVTFECEPANGSRVYEFPNPILVSFPNVVSKSINPDATSTDLKATCNGKPITFPNVMEWREPMTLSWRGADEPTAYGYYEIKFNAGYFNMTMTDGTVLPSPEIVISYNYSEPVDINSWSSTPTNGETIKELTGLSVTFDGATTVASAEDSSIEVTREGEAEPLSSSFTIAKIEGQTVTYRIERTGAAMTDGVYTVQIPKGSFILDGTEESPAVTFFFTVDSNLTEEDSFTTYLTLSDPKPYMPLNLVKSDHGMNELFYIFSETITINTACTEQIQLLYNGNAIAKISATAKESDGCFVECTQGGGGGFGSTGTWMSMTFGYENGKVMDRFEPGKYQVKIPNNFFMVGDKMLKGATMDYCIGMGQYIPAANETLNLKMPGANAKAVVDGKLAQILLNPWYSQFEINNTRNITTVDSNSMQETIVGTLKGTQVTATLTRDGQKVAEFDNFDSTVVYMQQGSIVFSLRNGGNTPLYQNGHYKLTFPENFFRTYDGGTSSTNVDEEYTYEFDVVGGRDANEPEQVYTVSPTPGTTTNPVKFTKFPTVTLTYDDVKSISVKNDAVAWLYYGTSTLTNETGKYAFDITASDNVVTLTPQVEIKDVPASEYVYLYLVVKEDSYNLTYNDGKTYGNQPVQIEGYNIEEPKTNAGDLVIDAFADGEITDGHDLITFTSTCDITIATYNMINAMSSGLYKIEDTRAKPAGTLVSNYVGAFSSATNTITWTLKNFYNGTWDEAQTLDQLTGGNYAIYIPASAYVTYDAATNKRTNSAEQTFYVYYDNQTGMVMLGEENAATIYNMNGVCLYKDAAPEVLSTLQPGIYVVNGRKVVVK